MKKTILVAACFAACLAHADSLQPSNFAYRAPLVVSEPGPFHQAVLPIELYQGLQRADLGDLRVFNAKGEVVPHALIKQEEMETERITETPLTMFPLTDTSADSNPDELAVQVRRSSDGTLISIQGKTGNRSTTAINRGLILDASKVKAGEHALKLETAASAVPFQGFTLETSDDLLQWRMLKQDAQLVHLEHEGQRISNDTVEWQGGMGKYLRILWHRPEQAPAVKAAVIKTTQASINRAPLVWSAAMAPSKSGDGWYDYTLPGKMPMEKLRINLPQLNTLAPVQVQRHEVGYKHMEHKGWWYTMAQTVAYRLKTPDGEARSADLTLNAAATNRLRLSVDPRSGGLGGTPPSIQIGFVPHILVFLARGDAPYTLGWGADHINSSALSISTLVPGYRNDRKLTAGIAQLGPFGTTSSAPASMQQQGKELSKGALWAVLIGGLLVLGAMAWMLLKQMKQSGKAPASADDGS